MPGMMSTCDQLETACSISKPSLPMDKGRHDTMSEPVSEVHCVGTGRDSSVSQGVLRVTHLQGPLLAGHGQCGAACSQHKQVSGVAAVVRSLQQHPVRQRG